MSKRTIKTVFDKAQQALAAKAEAELWSAFAARYANPKGFLDAVREFDACRYWQDAGFESIESYASACIPNARFREWQGWAVLASIGPHPSIVKLIKQRAIKVSRMSHLKGVVTPSNYRTWVFLAMHLNGLQLEEVIREWRKLVRTGYLGEAVFVPVWIPEREYERIFHGRITDDPERPAWDTLREALEATGKGKN